MDGEDGRESDFLMKEKGPGDLGAKGIESVLGSPGGLVGVMVPERLDLLGRDAADEAPPDSLSASRICAQKQRNVTQSQRPFWEALVDCQASWCLKPLIC